MLEPNYGLVAWTIITFVLLVLVLRSIAWRPLLDALHKREEHIRGSIERAEQAKVEAEKLLDEHRSRLAQAESDVQRLLNEGKSLGEKLKDEIVVKANQQSQRMINQAKQEIERDKDAALSQLRSEVADLAIRATEKILDESLDEPRQRKIIDTYLKELPRN